MKMNIEPAFTLLDLHQRLLPCREAYWSTNTKGVIQCLKRNLAVETGCIAFQAWHCLSAQVGFEPTATARKMLEIRQTTTLYVSVRNVTAGEGIASRHHRNAFIQ